jgi:hypothetical protein
MPFLPFPGREQEVSGPLKVATICHFRGIDVQVLIFGLEMAKRAFPAEICPLEMAFLPFSVPGPFFDRVHQK